MPGATLKLVARLAGVAPVTVSRVVNRSENVASETREKILAVIRDLNYTPNMHAANLRRKRLNRECTTVSKDRAIVAKERLKSVGFSRRDVSWGEVQFCPEECGALSRQMNQLRTDLDRLRKRTECLQSQLVRMQEALVRRRASGEVHSRVNVGLRGETCLGTVTRRTAAGDDQDACTSEPPTPPESSFQRNCAGASCTLPPLRLQICRLAQIAVRVRFRNLDHRQR